MKSGTGAPTTAAEAATDKEATTEQTKNPQEPTKAMKEY